MPRGWRRVRAWVRGSVVLALALIMLLPFLYMVTTALQGEQEATIPLGHFLLNSAVFATGVTLGQVVTSALAAYAFARLRFPGRDRVFLAFLSVLLVPAVVLLIPRFLMLHAVGWVDTYQGLISTEVVSVGGIFLLRQFFLTLPRDVEDAARLDGAGEWTIFRRVVLPLSRPALATLAVFAFLDQWKSFLWPLIATSSDAMSVAEVGLARVHGWYPMNWPLQMAAAVTVIAPAVIVFLVGQKYFMRGVQTIAGR